MSLRINFLEGWKQEKTFKVGCCLLVYKVKKLQVGLLLTGLQSTATGFL